MARVTAGIFKIKNRAPKWRVFADAVVAFLENDLTTSSAAISYYMMLLLFPLLILILSAGQAIVGGREMRHFLVDQVLAYLPGTRVFVRENVDKVSDFGSAGVVTCVLLVVWAASWIFAVIEKALNRIWLTPPRSFVKGRLLTIGMVGLSGLVLIGSALFTAGVAVIERASERISIRFPEGADIVLDVAFQVFFAILSLLVSIGLLALLYKVMPNTKVQWIETLPGAVIAGVVWEVLKYAFAFMLPWFLEEYRVLYGGVWLALVLMTWVYISALVSLFGAQLTALMHCEHVFSREPSRSAFPVAPDVAKLG